MPEIIVSVIVPARNEEALIGRTLSCILRAVERDPLHGSEVEVIVVDNASIDRTPEIVRHYVEAFGVQLIHCGQAGAPCARNSGARIARGRLFVFVDADTLIPPHALARVRHLCDDRSYQAGFAWLAPVEGGLRAWCWWTLWCLVRCLPLACAKAMPAFMFCTRSVFHEFGPFDEKIAIGEEWPILAGLYRARPHRLIYDRALIARTSSRRMELQPFGYLRTFSRYVWAVAHASGRHDYSDAWRHTLSSQEQTP